MSLDLTKPVRMRNGGHAKILLVDGGGQTPVIGAYQSNSDLWEPARWRSDGVYQCSDRGYDLVNVPERVKGEFWVNVYRGNDGGSWVDGPFNNQYDASGIGKLRAERIACVRFEYDVPVPPEARL